MNSVNQNIALNLLDFLMDKGSISLHSQVGTKDFLGKLINLLKSRENPGMQIKILGLIKKWGTMFEKSSDILPNFNQTYQALLGSGIKFPEKFVSEYLSFIGKEESSYVPQTTNQVAQPGNKGSNIEHSSSKRVVESTSKDSRQSNKPFKLKAEEFKKKYAQFIAEMNIVVDNIELANQIIDACNAGDQIDESLRSIMMTLKDCESSLLKAIQQIKDETLLSACLKLNDDLNQTSERFNLISAGSKPPRFISSFGWTTYLERKEEQVSQSIPSKKETAPKVQQPNQDIFGLFSDLTISNQPVQNNNKINNSSQPISSVDPFDIFGGGISNSSTTNNNPKPEVDINNILNGLSNPVPQPNPNFLDFSSSNNNKLGNPNVGFQSDPFGLGNTVQNRQPKPDINNILEKAYGQPQSGGNMPPTYNFNNAYPPTNINPNQNPIQPGYGYQNMNYPNPNPNQNFFGNMNPVYPPVNNSINQPYPQQQQYQVNQQPIQLNKNVVSYNIDFGSSSKESTKGKDKLDGLNPFA